MTIPAGFGQVLIGFQGTATPSGAAITFGIKNEGAQTASEIAGDVAAAWQSAGMPNSYSLNTTVTTVAVKLGPDDTGPAHELGVSFVGLLGTAGSPNVAYLVSKSTNTGGRRGRGRFFLPGVAEADVDPSGTILAARVTAVNTVLDNFAQSMITGQTPLYLLHDNNDPPSEIIDLVLSSRAATQRRRLRR